MYLAVDVGGTKTLLASFEEATGKLVSKTQFPTAKVYQDFLGDIETHVAELEADTFSAAGVAIPGIVDRENGIGISYGNLDWQNNPVTKDLTDLLNCPVYLENDAKAGGLSEALLIKSEFSNVLYLTIGTGIGIAHIVDGVNDLTVDDIGGHGLMIDFEGKAQPWEDFAGGSAIVKKFGKRASEITNPGEWKEIAHNLGVGILQLLQEYHPEVIIFSGGVGNYFKYFSEPLKSELEQAGITVPELRQAQSPDLAVVYGCYELIKQNHGSRRNSYE